MNNDTIHEEPIPEEHLPMEVDCKETTSNVSNHNIKIKKEPLSANDEHFQESLNILQEFVREKLHRTVLSFAEFKKLLLLRQTGEWIFLADRFVLYKLSSFFLIDLIFLSHVHS